MTITEVQSKNRAWFQIREAVPPNHFPPGQSIIGLMDIDAPLENKKSGPSELLFGA